MRRLTHWETGTVAGFLLVYTFVSLFAKRGPALTAFSDLSGMGLWLLTVAVMLWAAFSNTGRTRWFWFLMAFGAALVATNFVAWFCYELILGHEPPNPFWADIPIFLQPVPMMAAAAARAEVPPQHAELPDSSSLVGVPLPVPGLSKRVRRAERDGL